MSCDVNKQFGMRFALLEPIVDPWSPLESNFCCPCTSGANGDRLCLRGFVLGSERLVGPSCRCRSCSSRFVNQPNATCPTPSLPVPAGWPRRSLARPPPATLATSKVKLDVSCNAREVTWSGSHAGASAGGGGSLCAQEGIGRGRGADV